MGNSTNLIIQRSGVSFIWFTYFVSSHNFYYYKDLSCGFFFLYRFFEYFFKKYFLKFFRIGFFFSHLKIYVSKFQKYTCNLYFFDFYYIKMCHFFLFFFFRNYGKKRFKFFYKYNFLLKNKYELRYKALYNYKKFFNLYPNFLKTHYLKNLTFTFSKSSNWFFFFKNFYKSSNFFSFYDLKKLMFSKKFLSKQNKLKKFLSFIDIITRMVGLFDYKYETYQSQIDLYKYFFKNTENYVKFLKNEKFEFNIKKNFKKKKKFLYNSRYNTYGDVIKLKKIFLRDKYVEWYFLRFFIYFLLYYRFRQILFLNNKLLNKKFLVFLFFLLFKYLKKKLKKFNINFFNFFFLLKDKIIKSKNKFIKFLKILYNLFFIFFFRRLLKLFFKRFYIFLINNLIQFFQKKIYNIFKLTVNINFFFLSKYSLTPYILNNFFLYKLKKKFPFKEIVKKFLFKQKNLFLKGLFIKGAGRFTKKQRTSLYKLQKGHIFFTSFNQLVAYNMFLYISRYSICSIHFFFNYNKQLILNKKLKNINLLF